MKPGDLVPHFDVLTCSGRRFSYVGVWQRMRLVLITLNSAADTDALGELMAFEEQCRARQSVCVVTCEPIAGVPVPSVLVADQWAKSCIWQRHSTWTTFRPPHRCSSGWTIWNNVAPSARAKRSDFEET